MIHTYLVRYYQFDFGFLPYPIWIGVYDLVSTRYLYLVRATCVALVYEDETAMFGFANFHFLTKLFKTTALKSEKLPYLCTTVTLQNQCTITSYKHEQSYGIGFSSCTLDHSTQRMESYFS